MRIKEGQEKAYQDWFDKNTDPYGRACFTYAERWAEMLEAKIDETGNVERAVTEHAERLGHEADTEGIPGFMFGMPLSILIHCWEYGEELRKWYTKKYRPVPPAAPEVTGWGKGGNGMAEYGICVKEILKRTIIVDAGSLQEALGKVREAVDREEIILDSDDYDEGEVLPREDWEGGLVPEGKDVRHYQHLEETEAEETDPPKLYLY